MSHETTECSLALAKAAKQYGTLVSFDLNYRATFWKGREDALSEAFGEIASLAGVLIGNEEDFQLCLGFKGPEAGGKDLSSKIESFKGMISQVQEQYRTRSVCHNASSGHFGKRAPLGSDFAGGREMVCRRTQRDSGA